MSWQVVCKYTLDENPKPCYLKPKLPFHAELEHSTRQPRCPMTAWHRPLLSPDPSALGEVHSSQGRSAVVLPPFPAKHSWREVPCSCQASHTNLAPALEHAAGHEPTPGGSSAALCWWVLWDQQLGENSIRWNNARVTVLNGLIGSFSNIMTKKYSGTSLHNKVQEKKFCFSINDDVSQFSMKLS